MRKCPICRQEYDDGGNSWKKVCFPCYKGFAFLNGSSYDRASRVKNFGHKSNIYLAHPSVTKEEMDAWIVEKKLERGWGVQEWKPEDWGKYKIWIDSVNFD